MSTWSPVSWQSQPYPQEIHYPCSEALAKTLQRLSEQAPLVTEQEILALKAELAEARLGQRFILQGGDCAEVFSDCHPKLIHEKRDLLFKMGALLQSASQKPVTHIGRIAGQYAKPRSCPTETQAGIVLPIYRGELINGVAFSKEHRTPDPNRMMQGYQHAAKTLSYLKLFQDKMLFTSHEALHLPYEQAQTRLSPSGRWFNCSTHFPWIGVRTSISDSAHIEYLRGISNPIAIKVGPHTTEEWLKKTMTLLDPEKEPGRLTLITRLGVQHIKDQLPKLIQASQEIQHPVVWLCDPMHGNTHLTAQGLKTRHFDDILEEVTRSIFIHKEHDSLLNGVHFELTPEPVTECLGGPQKLDETRLAKAYHSLVDPRLNKEQSLEMAEKIAQLLNPNEMAEEITQRRNPNDQNTHY